MAGGPPPEGAGVDPRTGTVLWSGRPDASGSIAFSFQVPDVDPGSYTLIATQNDPNRAGFAASGTPARVSFQVTPSPVAAEPVAAAPAQEAAASPAPAATSRVPARS